MTTGQAGKKQPGVSATADATLPEQRGVAPYPIVGIGASAGGLEAFEQFFGAMPADSGIAVVLVPHLDPSHTSILSEILQRCTGMPVVEAQDQMAVLPNRVHVIPPNRDMAIFHGILQLSVPDVPRGQRMPIDAFLRSLAEDQGEQAVGIILSGTGTDGTLGLRAVLGNGGLTLVQDPATAKYSGMPASAIHAGYASQVVAAQDMPLALLDALRRRTASAVTIKQAELDEAGKPTTLASMNRLLLFVRSATGHDFSDRKSVV
jgi:two-component system CheB/CheR fusion protein